MLYIVGIVLIVVAVVLFLVYLIGGAGVIAYVATHPPRRPITQTPQEFGATYEDVEFPSRDGVKLSGWFVPAPPTLDGENRPGGAVILCHGMSANRQEVIPWAAALWERGFALLMFDFRALGNSGGRICTAGYSEKLDLLGAVDYLTTRPDMHDVPLGVFGFSMGGATAILTAAEDRRIHAVATHGAFATLKGAITQRCRHHYGPLGPIAERLTMAFGNRLRWFPVQPSAVMPVNVVAQLAPRPLLLLHGSKDRIVRTDDARELHAAAGHPKSLRVLPRSGHRRIHRHLRPMVERRVAQFFATTLQRTARRDAPVRERTPIRRSRHKHARSRRRLIHNG